MSNISAFLRRDRVTRVLTEDGYFRAAVVNATATALAGRKNHNLDAYSGYFLAQSLTVAAALASFLKGEERISLQFDGNGIIRSIFAESLQVGETRGYIRLADNAAEYTDNNTVQAGLGSGTLKVSKVLYNRSEPIIGIVPMYPESIARTMAGYLANSEQIPSAVSIDVALDDDGMIAFAGAMITQAMPGANTDDIRIVEETIASMPRLSELARSGAQADEILHIALGRNFKTVGSAPVDFFCRCSVERFKTILMAAGHDEIQSMHNQKQNELVCQYCNKHYYLSEHDFDELLTLLKAREN